MQGHQPGPRQPAFQARLLCCHLAACFHGFQKFLQDAMEIEQPNAKPRLCNISFPTIDRVLMSFFGPQAPVLCIHPHFIEEDGLEQYISAVLLWYFGESYTTEQIRSCFTYTPWVSHLYTNKLGCLLEQYQPFKSSYAEFKASTDIEAHHLTLWLNVPVPDNGQISQAPPFADGDEVLCAAAQLGDLETVKVLLTTGAEVDLISMEGKSPLYAAAEGGHEEVINILLSAGATLNLANKNGRTPLFAACLNGRVKCAKLLLEAGASVALLPDQSTAFHAAAMGGHEGVVQLLLQHNSGLVDQPSTIDGKSPLFLAMERGHTKVGKMLLAAGADLRRRDKVGRSMLFVAAAKGYVRTVKMLLDAGAELEPLRDNSTPLHAAALGGNLLVVGMMLRRCVDLSQANNEGKTPLYVAVEHGHAEVAKALLEAGADLHTKDLVGRSPLFVASFKGHDKVVEVLLEAGAVVEPLRDQSTALHAAALGGNPEVVRHLLWQEACKLLDLQNNDGKTALHVAAEQGHVEVAELLLSAGANPQVQTKIGHSPLSLAAGRGHLGVVRLMWRYDWGQAMPLWDKELQQYAALRQSVEQMHAGRTSSIQAGGGVMVLSIVAGLGDLLVMRALVPQGWVADARRGAQLAGPLCAAAGGGHLEVVQLLLAAGTVVDAPQQAGRTALHCAARGGHDEVVRALHAAGADLNFKDADNATPLIAAAKAGHASTVELLIQLGANMELRDKSDRNALHIAAKMGHTHVASALLGAGAKALAVAAERGDVQAVQVLLAAGAPKESTNKEVVRALKAAAHRQDVGLALALSQAGVEDVNVVMLPEFAAPDLAYIPDRADILQKGASDNEMLELYEAELLGANEVYNCGPSLQAPDSAAPKQVQAWLSQEGLMLGVASIYTAPLHIAACAVGEPEQMQRAGEPEPAIMSGAQVAAPLHK